MEIIITIVKMKCLTCVFGERMMVFAPRGGSSCSIRAGHQLAISWPQHHSWMGREALVTRAFRQVNWLRLNSWGLGSGLPSIVRRELLISCYR